MTGISVREPNFTHNFSETRFSLRPVNRVFIKYCVFFSRILESLPTLPRQHSTSIGCKKNYQPIGLTVHSHCVQSFENLLQRYVGEGGIAVNCEKHNFS